MAGSADIGIRDLGCIGFNEALLLQDELAAGVAAGNLPETLLLLEHPPVYTIGSGGSEANLLDPGIEVVRIGRGGDVTWHGPGQLICYPIVRLGDRGKDLHRYLRFLEEVMIRLAVDFGVNAERVPGKTGAWSAGGKIAAIGVGVRRWVTMHGAALNVAPDLEAFSRINPCGMAGCPVTSLERELGRPVAVGEVKEAVAGLFEPLLEEWLP